MKDRRADTMFHPMEVYIATGAHGKVSKLSKRASVLQMDSFDTNTYSHKMCLAIRDRLFPASLKQDIVLLQSCFRLNYIMPKTRGIETIDRSVLKEIGCGRFTEENQKITHNTEYLALNIKAYMEQKKIIFIMFGYLDYFVMPFLDEHGYVAHSVCSILIPRGDQYDCYYINSHGQDMKETIFYEWIISKSRTKKVTYSEPVDILLIKNLVTYWSSLTNIKIRYDSSSKHTYLGPNLQAGDVHGFCFIFPQIVWYYFGKYYHLKRCFGEEGQCYTATGMDMIERGALEDFMLLCFVDFCPRYRQTLIEHWIERTRSRKRMYRAIQMLIIERHTWFIKPILRALVHFAGQRGFQKAVERSRELSLDTNRFATDQKINAGSCVNEIP